MSTIMNGTEVSEQLRKEVKDVIRRCMIKPCLAVIQVGNDPASNSYIRGKEKACLEIGMYFKHLKYNENVLETELVNKIIELNNDDYVNGILIQLPLPEHLNAKKIVNLINSSKDVDGLNDINTGRLAHGRKCLIPCTPLGIMELLRAYQIDVEGKNVVIVGRSNLVGKPLSQLMLNRNATVTVCHSKTENLGEFTKKADILVSATGQKHLIKADMVKDGVVVIDVGITRENGVLCGDVDFAEVSKKASYITPVPGGVGPMTIALLLKNVMTNYKRITH